MNKEFNELKKLYNTIQPQIAERLSEFRKIFKNADNKRIFEELSFCILSSGAGPVMAQKSIDAIGTSLHTGDISEITNLLTGVHKYPDKAEYIVTTREYIKSVFNYNLIIHLSAIEDRIERRNFIAGTRSIRGVGMVQASHFLRNIGFTGYAILDRNILSSLMKLDVIEDSKPPSTVKRYIEKENKMIDFSEKLSISIDELDLLLWYRKNNKIPR